MLEKVKTALTAGKKRIISTALSVCMVVMSLPAITLPVSAAVTQRTTELDLTQTSLTYAGGVGTGDPTSANITDSTEGWKWYKTAGTDPDVGDVAANTLVLNGINLNTSDEVALNLPDDDTTIVQVSGSTNNVTTTSSASSPFAVYSEGTLTIKGNGTLTATASGGSTPTGISPHTLNIMGGTIIGKTNSTAGYGVFAQTNINVTGGRLTGMGGEEAIDSFNIVTTDVTIVGSTDFDAQTLVAATTNTIGLMDMNTVVISSDTSVKALTAMILGPTPAVTSVSVTPETVSVVKGGTQAFTADVVAVGGAEQTVSWTVSGNSSASTTIGTDGTLSVAADEPVGTTLTVTATSTFDDTKSDTATVSVINQVPRTTMLNLRTESALTYAGGLGTGDPTSANITDSTEGWKWYKTAGTDPDVGDVAANTLVLNGINLTFSGMEKSAVLLPAGSTIFLAADSTNTIIMSSSEMYAYGIKCAGVLNIKGTGTLNVTSTCAVYGDERGIATSGAFTLENGNVTAKGGDYGIYCDEGDISINGGTLKAIGGMRAITGTTDIITAVGLSIKGSAETDAVTLVAAEKDVTSFYHTIVLSSNTATIAKTVLISAPTTATFSYRNGTADSSSATKPAAPTWGTYSFDGWYTGIDGTGTALGEGTPAAGATYYAKWKNGTKTVVTTPLDLSAEANDIDKLAAEGWAWYATASDPYAANTLVLDGATIDCSAVTDANGYAVYLPSGAKVFLKDNTTNVINAGKSSTESNGILGVAAEILGNGTLNITAANATTLSTGIGMNRLTIGSDTYAPIINIKAGVAPNSFGIDVRTLVIVNGNFTMNGNKKASSGAIELTTSGTVTMKAGNNSNRFRVVTSYSGEPWVNISVIFEPTITVGAQTGAVIVGKGGSATFGITANNFETVPTFANSDIEFVGAHAGVTATVSGNTVTVTATKDAAKGDYKFTVKSGNIKSAEVTFSVIEMVKRTKPLDFSDLATLTKTDGTTPVTAGANGAYVCAEEGWTWYATQSAAYDVAAAITDSNHPANTLVLDGLNLDCSDQTVSTETYGIKLPADSTIVLNDGSENTIKSANYYNTTAGRSYAINLRGSTTITGAGSLTAIGGRAINRINANSSSYGIYLYKGTLSVTGNANVCGKTTEGSYGGGGVYADWTYDSDISVDNATLTGEAYATSWTTGIFAKDSITANNAEIVGRAGASTNAQGIYSKGTITLSNTQVTASTEGTNADAFAVYTNSGITALGATITNGTFDNGSFVSGTTKTITETDPTKDVLISFGPTIAVAAQNGTLTYKNTATTATFAVTPSNFTNTLTTGMYSIEWFTAVDGLTSTSAPTGVTLAKTNASTLTASIANTATAGSYYFKLTANDAGATETATSTVATLTIAKATKTATDDISVPIAGKSNTYNLTSLIEAGGAATAGAAAVGDSTFITVANVAGTTLSYTAASSTAGAVSTITIPVTGCTNYEDYNIVLTVTSVAKTDVTISGLTVDTAANLVYSGEAKTGYAGTASYSTTWSGTLTKTYYSGSTVASGTLLAGAPTDAGTYTVRLAIPDTDTTYKGYTDITFTITAKELTITGLAATNRDFNDTTTVALTGGTLSGKVGTDDVSCPMPIVGTIEDKNAENGKTVTVTKPTLTGEKKDNYTLADISGLTVDISAAKEATPTAPTVNYTDEKLATTAALKWRVGAGTYATCTADMAATAFGWDGTAAVTVDFVTPASDANHANSDAVQVTIKARPAAPANTLFTVTKPTGTTANGKLKATTGTYQYKTGTGAWTDWDGSEISGIANGTVYSVRNKATASDFASAAIDITVSVKANATITATEATDLTYNGSAQKCYTGEVTVSNGIDVSTLIYKYESTDTAGYDSATAPTDAGAYKLTISVPDTNADYVGNKVINFTIAKATITVKADNKSIEKDEALPSFTATYTGFVGTDIRTVVVATEATVTCLTADITTIGTYPITATGATFNAGFDKNYQFVYENGTLAVGALPVYTITATAGAGGTIDPNGATDVNKGDAKTFAITANSGYSISDVLVDNITIGASALVTFSNISENHTITASFGRLPLVISNITVATNPSVLTYYAGSVFNPTGLTLTVSYTDGTSETITYGSENASDFTFSPALGTLLTTSDTSVLVTYKGITNAIAITVNSIPEPYIPPVTTPTTTQPEPKDDPVDETEAPVDEPADEPIDEPEEQPADTLDDETDPTEPVEDIDEEPSEEPTTEPSEAPAPAVQTVSDEAEKPEFAIENIVGEFEIYVDGELVDSKYYTIGDDGTITFTEEFLQTLAEGNHEFTVSSASGTVSTDFTIASPANSNPPTGFVLPITGIALAAVIAAASKKREK